MAKKEKKAAEAKAAKKEKKVMTPEEKAAKKAARMEALKNRPAEQRPNSKQIDIIKVSDTSVVKNYGYAIKNKEGHVGVLVTSVVEVKGEAVSTSVTFIPGNLAVKAKKGHGTIGGVKTKKSKDEDDEDSSSED